MPLLDELMSKEDFSTWLKSLPPTPTVEDAKTILMDSEIINPGTEHAFVEGCFGIRYRNAVMVLKSEYKQIKKLLEEKG